MPVYPYGYGDSKLTREQLEGCTTVAKLHPEMWRRYIALCEFAASKGVPLGVGTGWRIQPANAGPQFAKPGNSNHEGFPADGVHGGAVAIDTVPNTSWDWMEQNLAAYGLRSFRNVNSEPWHIQPSEIPASRSYRSEPWTLATFALPEDDDVTDADILRVAATTAKVLSKDKTFLNAVSDIIWAEQIGGADQKEAAREKLRQIDNRVERIEKKLSALTMARFEVYEADGWRWLLRDDNGEPIAQSEPYASRDGAVRGARNVAETAPGADVEDLT